ncbi:hypothetical protein EDB84DRAFT_1086835 [Lactarius hengduanensis]|nr:hypothetical protein EDB84DRAFT_1086835 [Lactarius hengduanensis]
MLLRLEGQHGPCRATESIQEVVRALDLTMRDVEEAWSVWRHEYVRATLRSGISPSLPSSYDDVAELTVRLCVHPTAHRFRSLATPSRSSPGCLRRISVTVPPLPLRGQPLQRPISGVAGGGRTGYPSGHGTHISNLWEYRGIQLSCPNEQRSIPPVHLHPDPRCLPAVPCTATECFCWHMGLPPSPLSPSHRLSVAAAAAAAADT